MSQNGGGGNGGGGNFGPDKMWPVLGLMVAALLAWKSLTPAPEPNREPSASMDVVRDGRFETAFVTARECHAQEGRVWVDVDGGFDCISFVAAGTTTGAKSAVLFFNGDISDAQLMERSQASARVQEQKQADAVTAQFEIPFFIVGRPGLMGSTGYHRNGGRRDEAQVLNAALDAISSKFNLSRLALAGQSGGARIIAQLLVMGRRDIACAAMGSGAYDLPRLVGGGTRSTNIFGDPGRRYLVPMMHVAQISVDGGRRSFVIGDPRDTVTPFPEQQAWAEKLTAGGHHAVLVNAVAEPPEFHGTAKLAITAAALCAKGTNDAEIVRAVQKK
jgi:hypothetical protein